MGEMAKFVIKIALAVATGAALLVGVLALIGIIVSGLSSVGILTEMFALIGIFMPFNVGTVFTFASIAFAGLLAFVTARKVYEITTNFSQSTD